MFQPPTSRQCTSITSLALKTCMLTSAKGMPILLHLKSMIHTLDRCKVAFGIQLSGRLADLLCGSSHRRSGPYQGHGVTQALIHRETLGSAFAINCKGDTPCETRRDRLPCEVTVKFDANPSPNEQSRTWRRRHGTSAQEAPSHALPIKLNGG